MKQKTCSLLVLVQQITQLNLRGSLYPRRHKETKVNSEQKRKLHESPPRTLGEFCQQNFGGELRELLIEEGSRKQSKRTKQSKDSGGASRTVKSFSNFPLVGLDLFSPRGLQSSDRNEAHLRRGPPLRTQTATFPFLRRLVREIAWLCASHQEPKRFEQARRV